jgi:hypothetical protein
VFIIHNAILINPVMTHAAAGTLCTETIMAKGRIMIMAMAGITSIFHYHRHDHHFTDENSRRHDYSDNYYNNFGPRNGH